MDIYLVGIIVIAVICIILVAYLIWGKNLEQFLTAAQKRSQCIYEKNKDDKFDDCITECIASDNCDKQICNAICLDDEEWGMYRQRWIYKLYY